MTDAPARGSGRRDVLVLAVVALCLRVAYVAGIVALDGTGQSGDPEYMNQLGQSMAAGQGFILADGERIYNQSVGYPALLAVLYWAFGPDVWAALAANVALGALSVGLVYALARMLLRDASTSAPPIPRPRCSRTTKTSSSHAWVTVSVTTRAKPTMVGVAVARCTESGSDHRTDVSTTSRETPLRQ